MQNPHPRPEGKKPPPNPAPPRPAPQRIEVSLDEETRKWLADTLRAAVETATHKLMPVQRDADAEARARAAADAVFNLMPGRGL